MLLQELDPHKVTTRKCKMPIMRHKLDKTRPNTTRNPCSEQRCNMDAGLKMTFSSSLRAQTRRKNKPLLRLRDYFTNHLQHSEKKRSSVYIGQILSNWSLQSIPVITLTVLFLSRSPAVTKACFLFSVSHSGRVDN